MSLNHPSPDRQALEFVMERFEDAWLNGSRPSIEEYLKDAQGGIDLLVELALTDLEYRIKAGEAGRAEEYLGRFPALADHAIALIATEYRFRQRQDPGLQAEEFLRRFPDFAEELRKVLIAQTSTGTGTDACPDQSLMVGFPKVIGRYYVEGEIARGGMGVVLRVYDPEFDRPLAMKVLLRLDGVGVDYTQRFHREARTAGRLQHPGIPPLHSAGRLPDGRPYFTMKLIEGHTLEELFVNRGSPPDDLPRFLAIFGQVCQTLAYAHSQAVIHRDLKPANVMVGEFGEVQVMDWGLAKDHTSNPSPVEAQQSLAVAYDTLLSGSMTRTGDVMGTPAFMSPEQARGQSGHVGASTDVFGLGGLLCMILTGGPPFRGPNLNHVVVQARAADLADAYHRLDDCGADDELIGIAKRCLAAHPSDRYSDAGAVATAVADYQARLRQRLRDAELAGERQRVQAAEERKRRRVQFALTASLLVLTLGAGVAGVWYQADRADRAIALAEQRDQDEQDARGVLQRLSVQVARAETLEGGVDGQGNAIRNAQGEATRLRGLLNRASRPLSEAVHGEAKGELAKLDAIGRDHALFLAFEEYRRKRAETDSLGSRFLDAEALADLLEAVAKYGIEVGITPAGEVVRKIEDRPWSVQARLLDLLSVALLDSDKEPERLRWLNAVLARTQADPLKDRIVRSIIGSHSAEALRLILSLDPPAHSPAFLTAVVRHLPAEDHDARVKFLRNCVRYHGDDFWLNLRVGAALVREIEFITPVTTTGLPLQKIQGYTLDSMSSWPSSEPRLNPERKAELVSALRYYITASALRQDHPLAHLLRGLTAHLLGDYDEAEVAYRNVIRLIPDYLPARIGRSALFLYRRQWDEVIRELAPLASDSGLAELHYNLGLAYQGKGEHAAAVMSLKRAITLREEFPEAHSMLGVSYAWQGDFDAAVCASERALKRAPGVPEILANAGTVLFLKGDLDGAIDKCAAALAIDPDFAGAHLNLGKIHVKRGQLRNASDEFRAALAADPTLGVASVELGTVKAALGDMKGAAEAYQNAISVGETTPSAYAGLSGALGELGDLPGSLVAARQAIRIAPTFALGHSNVGVALYRLGRLEEADAAFRRSIECDGTYFEARAHLVSLLAGRGDFEDALRALKAMAEADLDHPAADTFIQKQTAEGTRLVKLDGQLDAILAGEVTPEKDDLIGLAKLCYFHRGRPLAAARFYEKAFEARPQLAHNLRSPNRYDAARAAVKAVAQGADIAWSAKARAWLRADLKTLSGMASLSQPAHRQIAKMLAGWRADVDLASVREPGSLPQLPDGERQRWSKLWAEVDMLIQRTKPGGR